MIYSIVYQIYNQEMHPDDTHLTYADKDIYSIVASLNRDLLNINPSLIAKKLTPNMTKIEFMF